MFKSTHTTLHLSTVTTKMLTYLSKIPHNQDTRVVQEVTTSKVQDAFEALLRKQDALRDELRGNMLLEVASACQKHFQQKLPAKSASVADSNNVVDWHAEQHHLIGVARYSSTSCAF